MEPNRSWLDALLDELSDAANWSYQPGGVLATEAAALAALALAAHGRYEAALDACRRLARLQSADGSLGIQENRPKPCWPTGWAVLAWKSAAAHADQNNFQQNVDAAIGWILAQHGHTLERMSEMGHDTRLDGWPWVAGTHPFCEPTAINVLALKATARGGHPRAREACAMLIDRLLPQGGCNYGNTSVLGQVLRPHVEPTGLIVAALSGETDVSGRLDRSLAYLKRVLGTTRGAASLAYAVLGLAAHRRRPIETDDRLAAAARQSNTWQKPPLRKALLALAAAEPCALTPYNHHG